MWRTKIFFCLGSRLDARSQEVWPCHENKSRERCGSRASSLVFDFFTIGSGVLFFSVVGQWLQWHSGGPCCQL